ncbi:MAG TPA: hypothetical protein VLG50_07140 [Candidatus Saccharimonadales bacterium]|nr:hypothetical protein [Candidatus Saccharimonadales bacterium]
MEYKGFTEVEDVDKVIINMLPLSDVQKLCQTYNRSLTTICQTYVQRKLDESDKKVNNIDFDEDEDITIDINNKLDYVYFYNLAIILNVKISKGRHFDHYFKINNKISEITLEFLDFKYIFDCHHKIKICNINLSYDNQDDYILNLPDLTILLKSPREFLTHVFYDLSN